MGVKYESANEGVVLRIIYKLVSFVIKLLFPMILLTQ